MVIYATCSTNNVCLLYMCINIYYIVGNEMESLNPSLVIRFKLLSQTQQQQMADANTWKLSIIELMWNDRPQNDQNENQEEEMRIKRMTMKITMNK